MKVNSKTCQIGCMFCLHEGEQLLDEREGDDALAAILNGVDISMDHANELLDEIANEVLENREVKKILIMMAPWCSINHPIRLSNSIPSIHPSHFK